MAYILQRAFSSLLSEVKKRDDPDSVIAQLKTLSNHQHFQYVGKVCLLVQSAKWNRVNTLRAILKFWKSRNELHLLINTMYPESKETPLRWAALNGSVDAIRLLLEYGADVNEKEMYNAIGAKSVRSYVGSHYLGYLEETDKLSKATYDEKAPRRTPLYWACLGNSTASADVLLQNRSDVNISDSNKWTPAHWAAFHGNDQMLSNLLANGAKPNGRVCGVPQPFTSMVSRDNPARLEFFSVLMEMARRSGFPNWYGGWTSLSFAARRLSIGSMKLLLEHGADPNPKETSGRRLFSSIIDTDRGPYNSVFAVLDLLIEHGANIDAGGSKMCALYHATRKGDIALVKYLLKKGATVSPDCLLAAAGTGNIGLCRLFIDSGSNVDYFDGISTPLSAASRIGSMEVVDHLLQNGADANEPLRDAEARPLCRACKSHVNETGKIKKVILRLMESGADGSMPSVPWDNKTPLHVFHKELKRKSIIPSRRAALVEVVALLEFQQFAVMYGRDDSIFFSFLNRDESTSQGLLKKIGGYLISDDDVEVVLQGIAKSTS
jgi:ankyrin repeat protein